MRSRWQSLVDRLRFRPGVPLLSGPGADSGDGPLLDEAFLKSIERLSLGDLDTVLEGLTGEHAGRSKTQAIEFNDYRGYSPGDDLRQIDWNVYARLGELFVKTSLAEENISLCLLVDRSRSMDWGRPNKLWYAKRLAATLGAIALLHYDTVRVYGLGDGRAIAGTDLRGHNALPFLIRELEAMPVASTTGLVGAIEEYRRLSDLRGAVVLLSDFLVPSDQIAAVEFLAGGSGRAAVLQIVDEAEAMPPLSGAIELRDLESGERVEIVITPNIRRRYVDRFNARSQELAARAAARRVGYIRVPTAISPADLVLGALRREGLVRA